MADAENKAVEQFGFAQEFAEDAYDAAIDFLGDLRQAIVDAQTIGIEISKDVVDIGVTFQPPAFPTNPPPIPTITDPVVSVTIEEDVYLSNLLNKLNTFLFDELDTDKVGLGTDVEQAMFDRETERDLLELQDAYDRTSSEYAARGFDLPSGFLNADLTTLNVTYTNKKLDKSRQITEETRRLAIQHVQFVIQQIVALESQLMTYIGSYWDRKLRVAIAVNEASIALTNALVAKYQGQVEAYKASTEAYGALVGAESSRVAAVVDIAKTRIQQSLGLLEADLKVLELKLGQFSTLANLDMEAAKSGGTIAATLAAGALSSVSASVHVSDTISISNQTSQSTSAQTSASTNTNYNYNKEVL